MVRFTYSPIVGSDESGEYHPTGGYASSLKRNEKDLFNNYYIIIKFNSLFKFKEKGWRLFIYLALQCFHSTSNLIYDYKFDTLDKAKRWAKDAIYSFDKYHSFGYLQSWKNENCKPTFNSNLEWVGDTYFGYSYVTYNPEYEKPIDYYDYFNDNKIEYTKGIYYHLDIINDRLVLFKTSINSFGHGSETVDDEELKKVLLDKTIKMIDDVRVGNRYNRFRRF